MATEEEIVKIKIEDEIHKAYLELIKLADADIESAHGFNRSC